MRAEHEYTLAVAATTQVRTGPKTASSRNLLLWEKPLGPAQGVKAIQRRGKC
jgi:hypothetical protein